MVYHLTPIHMCCSYRKDLFEEAGLDPDSPPAIWAELEEYAQALDVPNGDDWDQFGFYPLWNLGADVWGIDADEGTSWFDEEGNVMVNTPEKVSALEWILEWQDHYGLDNINAYEAEFGSGVTDPFISGLIAMRGQNINYYTDLRENAPDDFNFGVAPLPEYEDGTGNWTWGGGFVLEIPYGAEYPEESYEFMKYATSTEVQERFGLNSFDIMANQEANENLVEHPDLDEEGQMIYELADSNFENTEQYVTQPSVHVSLQKVQIFSAQESPGPTTHACARGSLGQFRDGRNFDSPTLIIAQMQMQAIQPQLGHDIHDCHKVLDPKKVPSNIYTQATPFELWPIRDHEVRDGSRGP